MIRQRGRKLLVLAATTSLLVAACSSDDNASSSSPGSDDPVAATNGSGTGAPGTGTEVPNTTNDDTSDASADAGVVTYANAQEFSAYNNNLATSNSVKNGLVLNRVLPDTFNYTGPDGALEMDDALLDSAKLISDDPQVIEYVVNADAVWSDGDPIDCDDFVLAQNALSGKYKQLDDSGNPVTDPESDAELLLFEVAGTTGHDQIASLDCSDDGKTITTTYSTPFADWNSLFTNMVPAHIVERETGVADLVQAFADDDLDAIDKIAGFYNTAWALNPGELKPDIMPSGDSMQIDSWNAGQSLTLVPNENYWGEPAVSTVTIRYIAEEAQAQALANGEINAMDPQPTPDLLGQLDGIQGATVQSTSQFTYEHFDFNFNNPTLQDFKVRQAFAKCLPRQQIVDNLIVPLNPDAQVLNNRWIEPFEDGYEDTSGGDYDATDIDGAKALLQEAGVDTPLPLRIGWYDNGGNQRRKDQVALTIESCDQAGFDISDAGSDTFFDVELAAGDWDIAMFAWSGGPNKTGASSTYSGSGGNNVGEYNNPEVDSLISQLNESLDPSEVLALANQIDTILWQDLATIPVFSFPGVVAYTDNTQNIVYNPSQNGLTWNSDRWSLT